MATRIDIATLYSIPRTDKNYSHARSRSSSYCGAVRNAINLQYTPPCIYGTVAERRFGDLSLAGARRTTVGTTFVVGRWPIWKHTCGVEGQWEERAPSRPVTCRLIFHHRSRTPQRPVLPSSDSPTTARDPLSHRVCSSLRWHLLPGKKDTPISRWGLAIVAMETPG